MFVNKLYAVIGGSEGEGILSMDGMPLVCLSKENKTALSFVAEQISKQTGKRVCLVEFISTQILNEYGGENGTTNHSN